MQGSRNYLTDLLAISLFIAVTFFFINNYGGSISNAEETLGHLYSTPDDMFNWKTSLTQSNRILLRILLHGLYNLFDLPHNPQVFWIFFFLFMLILHIAASCLLYIFLRVLNFDRRLSLIGTGLVAALPGNMFAYAALVFTRNDMLAYNLILLGLISIAKEKFYWFLLFGILGLLTREPAGMLFFQYSANQYYLKGLKGIISRKSFLTALVVLCTVITVRIIYHEEPFDRVEAGLYFNISNLTESIVFIFITFGPLWFIGISGYRLVISGTDANEINEHRYFILKSAPFMIVITLISAFLLAHVREIRVLHISFLWLMVLCLQLIEVHWRCMGDFVGENRKAIATGGGIVLGAAAVSLLSGHLYIPGWTGDEISFLESYLWSSVLIIEIAGSFLFFWWYRWKRFDPEFAR
ncbi:MAG: hypothetical protein QF701_14550 [Nitrospinota bacterium]|nr:hypothetical protein [Nitrospinota bacterium]